jgi:serine/threonine protein kinase
MPSANRAAVALLVGIGDYRHRDRITTLRYAPRDARALARILAEPGIGGFPEGSVVTLTDARATRAAIVEHLSAWLPRVARGAELAVIYFAGHGVVERVENREEGFLLPHDANPDDVAGGGIPMGDLKRWIEQLSVGAVVVCLDCCHSGNIVLRDGVLLRDNERDMRIQPSLLANMAGRGRFLIASCDRGQKSIEAEELKHGLFTYHLLRGLRGAGDRDGDGKVGIAELFSYVAAAVSKDAREKFQREQTPWTSFVASGDVILSTVPPRRPSRPAEAPAGEADNEVLAAMQRLCRAPDPDRVHEMFRALAHDSEAVARRARRALHALGWDRVRAAVGDLAGQGAEEPLFHVLRGLEKLEAHAEVVALLDLLAFRLKGALRDRALRELDHKRLSLQLEDVRGLFRERHIPYRLERVLGPGLYTAAYLARAELTNHTAVVRVLRPQFAVQPHVRARFLDLGSRSMPLVHQNLVLTREVRAFAERDLYFTVRDHIDGITLRHALEGKKRFEPLQSVKILRQVLEGLTPLHRAGLAHGGVKPSNIFFRRDDPDNVILGDPSLPPPADGCDLPRLAYDFRYVPPELFRAGGELGPASDFYALGCVAHELFRGAAPFVSDSHYELITRHQRDPIPLGADAFTPLLAGLLARDPGPRFGSIAEVLRVLDRLAAGLQRPPLPPEAAGPPAPPAPPPAGLGERRRAEQADLGHPVDAGAASPPSSVRLLHEASLVQYESRPSIVPFHATVAEAAGQVTGAGDWQASLGGAPTGRIQPGMVIDGYRILEIIGRGGMGAVYKAQQIDLHRLVALKVIAAAGPKDDFQERFRAEAQAVARLQHPNIVQIFGVGEWEGQRYIAFEYLEGGSLANLLHRLEGPLAPRDAAALVEHLAQAVQHAHERHIIHRDLKPSNVLLDGVGRPKITDFGLAKRLEDAGRTGVGQILGTPSYMAPEQAQGKTREIGPAADVYGLGAVLYDCLTGRPPFRADSLADTILQVISTEPVPPSRLQPKVPRDLETITLKCLQKDPRRRYASAGELAADLRRFLDGAPIMALPLTWLERLGRLLRWRR